MKYLSKGAKTDSDGVLFSFEEYENYKKLSETVNQILARKKEYDKRYYPWRKGKYI